MTHLRLCSRVIQLLLHLFLHGSHTTITCLPLLLYQGVLLHLGIFLHLGILLHLGTLPLEHLQSASPTNVTIRLR